MLFFSIIIPLYNSEKFIKKCINSCLSQSMDKSNYEIILVDDGSTDNSLRIIKEIEEKEFNIRVFSQENQKQGAARNYGLRKAKGKFIWFVDSDDWLEPDSLIRLFEFLKDNDYEVVRIDSKNYYNGEYSDRKCGHTPLKNYSGKQILIDNNFSVSFPSHIFLKKFLISNNLYFREKIYFEDNELMSRVLFKCNNFIYYNEHLYTVYLRYDSTTRTENYSRYLDLIKVIGFQIEYIKNQDFQNHEASIMKAICIQIGRNMNKCLIKVSQSNGKEFEKAKNMLLSIKNLSNYLIQSRSFFHIIQYYLLNFPWLLKRLLRFYY